MRNSIKGNKNILANRDVNIYELPDEKREQGILEEIFQFVLDKIDNIESNRTKPDKLLHTKEKIELNFRDNNEQEEVKIYFTNCYHKISLIEKYFETLDIEEQSDIHNYAYLNYQELKEKFKKPILVLRELFKIFIPDLKEKDPQYVNIANALVLFFFDDCTIFEKTKGEKNIQTTLFDNL